ncbi:MAG: HAMP domain-containing protein [Myxococcota bacterium]
MRWTGLNAEVLLSLALVMLAANVVLAVVLLDHGEDRLRELLGRGLLAETRGVRSADAPVIAQADWWLLHGNGSEEPLHGGVEPADAPTRELAQRARREGASLLQPGPVWQQIRFAAPVGNGDVLVARLPRDASLRLRAAPIVVAAAVLLADVAIFTAFGMSLLRRRVVLPLRRLSAAARSIADGALEARVPVEGPREVEELATAFNEMTEALERRTRSLEKAVVDLRALNQELRQAHAGLDRAERLAAVGRLAAGVAHEVGNPVGALLALLDLAGRDDSLSDAARGHLARAAEQGGRVRRILRQLLEFSQPPRRSPGALDLVALAEDTLGAVSAQRRYAGIHFQVRREGEPPLAWGDRGAAEQVLLNLALNAADAALGADRPRVELRVCGASLEERRGESRDAAAGRRDPEAVECLVCDSGAGIAPEDRERIFDPFFTTKPPGEGTGLGLANSLRLAEDDGGRLELAPAPEGFATAFSLRLPVAGAEVPGSRARA